MIILNTTFVVSTAVEASFLRWLEDTYVPAMAQAGIFTRPTLARVLAQIEPRTDSYALQARCGSFDRALRWHDVTAAPLRDDIKTRWGDRVLPFTTFLEELPLATNPAGKGR